MGEYELKKAKIKSLKDTAYDAIKDAILSDNIQAGTKLIEADLADQLGISRGPIREALRQLESDGLVHSEPYKGTVVAQRSEEEATSVYIPIRQIIESYAWKKASETFTEDDYDYIDRHIKKLEALCNAKEYESASGVDDKIHHYIVSRCTSEMLTSLWESLSTYFYARIVFQNRISQILDDSPKQHYDMVDAIKSGDHETIDRVIVEHIR